MSPALQALTNYRQFILYKLVPSSRSGKMDKLPVNPNTLEVANAHDKTIWLSYDEVVAIVKVYGQGYGIGFVFTEADPFFFLDIDNCIDEQNKLNEIGTYLKSVFQGAAVEVSQSGKGLHIIGTTSPIKHSCKNKDFNIELYTSGRFCALTNRDVIGNAGTDCTAILTDTVNRYFPPTELTTSDEWRFEAVPEWSGPLDDDQLIAKARASSSGKSTFGGGVSFNDLWTNNIPVLAAKYPPLNDVDPYDRSSADAALAQHLAFWTGKNHNRIWELMCKSALLRDKWTWHKTYLQMTITRAVNNQGDVYKQSGAAQGAIGGTEGPDGLIMAAGLQLLTPSAQSEHFKGCVYVSDQHKIFVPDGRLLKPEQFKVAYGGYDFSMDTINNRTIRNAWECFTESQAIKFPQVHTTCFRPELPPGKIIEEESRTLVNTYVPIITKRQRGNVEPFLNFFKTIIKIENDREVLLAYMAACVQFKGVKFQWCPLIQGVEGNGKTLLGKVVSYGVGNRYTHLPNAGDLGANGMKFSAWLQGKLLIIIEEIYTVDKRHVTEPLKVLITNDRIEIQAKGKDQYTGDNRANFILFSNHKDAIHVTIDSRRYFVCYSGQQSNSDIIRDGMGGSYFPGLYNWLNKQNGYEYVNEFLHTYTIPDEFNPAGECQRAPKSSSMREAIELSISSVEAEIMEAIEEGRPGFVEPWVSSMALDKLLNEAGLDKCVPKNRRRKLLDEMGYIRHPGLENGRLINIIPYEGGKPRLYIKKEHIHAQLINSTDIHRYYLLSQGYFESSNPNVIPFNSI